MTYFRNSTPPGALKNRIGAMGIFRVGKSGFIAVALATVFSMTPPAVHHLSFIKAAQAESKPVLNLSVTGPKKAQVGKPLNGLTIHLNNPGLAMSDSRLRLFIHNEADREMQPGDITIAVLENNTAVDMPVEPIDGGVMGAIGQMGQSHKERHGRGGFAIAEKANLSWQIRPTFKVAGRYSLVVAISPDNGDSHFAKPLAFTLEAL